MAGLRAAGTGSAAGKAGEVRRGYTNTTQAPPLEPSYWEPLCADTPPTLSYSDAGPYITIIPARLVLTTTQTFRQTFGWLICVAQSSKRTE